MSAGATQTTTTTAGGAAAPPPGAAGAAAGAVAPPPAESFLSAPASNDGEKKVATSGAAEGAGKAAEKKDSTDTEKKVAEGEKKPDADFELKTPDGVEADAEFLGEFKSWAKESGLKGENAQKLYDLHTKAQQRAAQQANEKLNTAWDQKQKEWKQALESDKEVGGPELKANQLVATKAMKKFGDAEVTSILNAAGLGNHPALARMFVRIGKAIADDSIAGTSDAPPPVSSQEERLKIAYPSMFPKKE